MRLALATLIALLLMPAVAQAAATRDYCNKTLLGSPGVTLAPDNDIGIEWNRIESFGIDVKAAVAMSATQVSGDIRYNWWYFQRANGQIRQEVFDCWRDFDLYGNRTGTYHDALYSIPTGWYYP